MPAERAEGGERVCAFDAARHLALGRTGRFNRPQSPSATAPPEGERVSAGRVRGELALTRSGAIPDLLPPAGGRCPRSGQRGASVSVRSYRPDVASRSRAQTGSTGLSRLTPDVTSRSRAQSGSTGLSRLTPDVASRSRAQAGSTPSPAFGRSSPRGGAGQRGARSGELALTRSSAIPDLLPPAGGRCPRSGQRGASVSVRSQPDVASRSRAQSGSTPSVACGDSSPRGGAGQRGGRVSVLTERGDCPGFLDLTERPPTTVVGRRRRASASGPPASSHPCASRRGRFGRRCEP